MIEVKMRPEDAAQEYEELADDLGFAWEQYGELYAEHQGEVARFGDSWPGAQPQLARFLASLHASERRLQYLADVLGRGPVQGPTALDVPDAAAQGAYDQPF